MSLTNPMIAEAILLINSQREILNSMEIKLSSRSADKTVSLDASDCDRVSAVLKHHQPNLMPAEHSELKAHKMVAGIIISSVVALIASILVITYDGGLSELSGALMGGVIGLGIALAVVFWFGAVVYRNLEKSAKPIRGNDLNIFGSNIDYLNRFEGLHPEVRHFVEEIGDRLPNHHEYELAVRAANLAFDLQKKHDWKPRDRSETEWKKFKVRILSAEAN